MECVGLDLPVFPYLDCFVLVMDLCHLNVVSMGVICICLREPTGLQVVERLYV